MLLPLPWPSLWCGPWDEDQASFSGKAPVLGGSSGIVELWIQKHKSFENGLNLDLQIHRHMYQETSILLTTLIPIITLWVQYFTSRQLLVQIIKIYQNRQAVAV